MKCSTPKSRQASLVSARQTRRIALYLLLAFVALWLVQKMILSFWPGPSPERISLSRDEDYAVFEGTRQGMPLHILALNTIPEPKYRAIHATVISVTWHYPSNSDCMPNESANGRRSRLDRRLGEAVGTDGVLGVLWTGTCLMTWDFYVRDAEAVAERVIEVLKKEANPFDVRLAKVADPEWRMLTDLHREEAHLRRSGSPLPTTRL